MREGVKGALSGAHVNAMTLRTVLGPTDVTRLKLRR